MMKFRFRHVIRLAGIRSPGSWPVGLSPFPSSPFDASFADYNLLLNYLVHRGRFPHQCILSSLLPSPFPSPFVCTDTPAVVTQVHLLIPTPSSILFVLFSKASWYPYCPLTVRWEAFWFDFLSVGSGSKLNWNEIQFMATFSVPIRRCADLFLCWRQFHQRWFLWTSLTEESLSYLFLISPEAIFSPKATLDSQRNQYPFSSDSFLVNNHFSDRIMGGRTLLFSGPRVLDQFAT